MKNHSITKTLLCINSLLCRFSNATELTYDTIGRLDHEKLNDIIIKSNYDDNGNRLSCLVTKPIDLILTIDPPGSGNVSGSGKYYKTKTAALTATPSSAFDFAFWTSEDGTVLSNTPDYLYTVVSSAHVIAHFTAIEAPTITASPSGGVLSQGSPLNLSVSAYGRGPLTYNWSLNGKPLVESSSSLFRPAASFLDAGTYTVEVGNPGGKVTSQSTLVTIPIASYSAWKSVIFTPAEIAANSPSLIGQDAKIASDGMTNLMHFALGSKDRNSIPLDAFGLYQESPQSKSPGFEYNRLIGGGGLNYKVEISPDLRSWDASETNLEEQGTATPNSDGITEKVKVDLKEPMRSSLPSAFFRLAVSDKNSQDIVLSSVSDFKYSDDNGTLSIRSETPIPGKFEATPGGILVHSSYYRSGGAVITKENFILEGKIAEFVWEGSEGTPGMFMQAVCGSISNSWLTSPDIDSSLTISTFGNSWGGSWVATPGVTYKTSVTFTATGASMVTTEAASGRECGRLALNGRDFSVPQRLFIRLGDTYDYEGSFILLKSLTIKDVPPPPASTDQILSSIGDFKYTDSDNGSSVIRSESPIPGRFESDPAGVRVHSSYRRSMGFLITKDAFVLQGKVAEFLWEGSGGDQFMQAGCGTSINEWATNPEVDAWLTICTFYNSWDGSWVADKNTTYKTSVTFTATGASMVTTEAASGRECGRLALNGRDFSVPQRLFIRLGDTYDYEGSFILLKSLTIKAPL